ncbi:hypothetical protein IHE45_07G054400 [Dioscorea alata]|uniref:Uncharacterized protein n=1 Tax=Dioscorea alata TaxID=55571 RepID=A0ACB7VR48_DIOAL|nr:hypothetical protein IHE45_07G054400 [Dioscorea alata]
MNALVSFVEAVKISRRNQKDLILFLLFALTPLNLLKMLSDHHLPPTLVMDLFPTQPSNPTTKLELNFVSLVLATLSTLAIVYFSAMVCSGEKATLEAMFLKVRRTWWRPAVTLVYVIILVSLPSAVFLLMLKMPFAGLIEKLGFLPMFVMIILFSVFMILWVLCLSFAQRWGLVNSIMEEGCYGMEAIWRSWDFMRQRKLQVFLLVLLSLPQELVVLKVSSYLKTGELIQIAWALPLYLIGAIYDSLVYTVFYCYNN